MPLEDTPDRLTDRDNAVEQILSEVCEKHPRVLEAALWEAGDEDSVTIEVRLHLKGVTSTLPDSVARELQYAMNSIFGEDLWLAPRTQAQLVSIDAANAELAQVAAERREHQSPSELLLDAVNAGGEVFVVDSVSGPPLAEIATLFAMANVYDEAAKERFGKPYHHLDGPQRKEIKVLVFTRVYGGHN